MHEYIINSYFLIMGRSKQTGRVSE